MKSFNIRLLYLYLFSFVGLLITVIGCIRLLELGMKVYVFKGADQYSYYDVKPLTPEGTTKEMTPEEQQVYEEKQKKQQGEETIRSRQREFSGALAMIIVGVPLYLYHWKTIKKENKV